MKLSISYTKNSSIYKYLISLLVSVHPPPHPPLVVTTNPEKCRVNINISLAPNNFPMNGTTSYKNFLCVTQMQLVSRDAHNHPQEPSSCVTAVCPRWTGDWAGGGSWLLAALVTRATHGGAGDRAATRCCPGGQGGGQTAVTHLISSQ